VQLRKVELPSGKSFFWACDGPDCPWESEEITYTMENYDPYPPLSCPKCGRANQVDLMGVGIPAVPQPTSTPSGLSERVGWRPVREEDPHLS
jgi:hypothetical protein